MDTLSDAEVRALLDKNDSVRAGLGKQGGFLVPSVVVVGAQSHGKSSVLEMLSGIKLPAGTGMVTKRPLVIQLRRGADKKTSIRFKARDGVDEVQISQQQVTESVSKETSRSDDEQRKLRNPTGIVDLEMTLRIEGAHLPDVTLIDLPGIKYDDAEAEKRIKSLIRGRILPESAIILVVHNAVVDTDTNEGFKLAREVDPAGRRTLTVLTHVDCINDEQTMQRAVMNYLEQPGTSTYVAVRCPSESEHKTISHEVARDREMQYFQTHTLLKHANNTGLAALSKIIGTMYKQAVVAAQQPLRAELFKRRAEVEHQLSDLPPPCSPSRRFGDLWDEMALVAQRVVTGQHDPCAHPKLALQKISEWLSQVLLLLPTKIASDDKAFPNLGISRLMENLDTTSATMLPNFNPFEPLRQYNADVAEKYLGEAARVFTDCLGKQLEETIHRTMRQLRVQHSGEVYVAALDLIQQQAHVVAEGVQDRVRVRLDDCVDDEKASMWTANASFFTATRNKLWTVFKEGNSENGPGAALRKRNWADVSAVKKDRTADYFFSWCAYWKLMIKATIDTMVKIIRCELDRFPSQLRQHVQDIDDNAVLDALAGFIDLTKQADRLLQTKQRLEAAHAILAANGQAPPLSSHHLRRRGKEETNGGDVKGQTRPGKDIFSRLEGDVKDMV